MAKLSGINEVWNTVKEMDLRPLTDQALTMVKIALVGAPGAARDQLAEQMRRDPARPDSRTQSPLHVVDVQDGRNADGADLIILLVDGGGDSRSRALSAGGDSDTGVGDSVAGVGGKTPTGVGDSKSAGATGDSNAGKTPTGVGDSNAGKTPTGVGDSKSAGATGDSNAGKTPTGVGDSKNAGATGDSKEERLARGWAAAGKVVLVLVNLAPEAAGGGTGPWIDWGQRRLLYGSVGDVRFLGHDFANAVADLLNNQWLSLGRHFPLFRQVIANRMINEACLTNATYSLSTGLAQIIPVFDLPLNVADMVVLSKNQAFLAYKLGLALGMSTRWQDYLAEFGGVLGSGFLWRQAARSLVGLIPLWGIVPKVAVAYTGTYVVGHTVLQWYLTGRRLNSDQMRELTRQAYARGRHLAQNLARRTPRLRAPRVKLPSLKLPGGRKKKQAAQLTAGEMGSQAPALPATNAWRECPNCGRQSATDAKFCQYCAAPL